MINLDEVVPLLQRTPESLSALLSGLPNVWSSATEGEGTWSPYDVIVAFCPDRRRLERRFAPLATRLATAGALWVAWPKRASGVATDLDENVVREVGLGEGLVDVKVIAIDETWSGLKFVRRLRDR